MAYRRGGFFRSRFIAPRSQRAMEVLSKPVVSQVAASYEATARSLATPVLDNQTVIFTPLVVTNASGQERLAVLGGYSGSTLADFDSVTIDGQIATRVGTVSRATGTAHYVVVSGDNGSVTTANFGGTTFTGTAPAGFSAWGAAATLNPSDKKSSLVVLSGGNLTVTGTDTSNNWVRSTTATTGKRYAEFTATTVANTVIGIADLATITFPGADAHSFGLFSNGFGSIAGIFPAWGTSYVSGNVLCMAVDLDNRLVWFRVGAAGNWNGSATANPATATEGISVSAYTAASVAFVTAYRAPGTINTSINVVATADLGGSSESISNSYCACFRLASAGTLLATTRSASNDPTLSANTVTSGSAVAGLLGYGPSLLSGSGFVAWTGLTERLEDNGSADLVFSVASLDVSSTSTPLAISADLTPNLTAAGNAVASLSISFSPVALRSLPAIGGSYALIGAVASQLRIRRLTADGGTYSLTGTNATPRRGLTMTALGGTYALSGTDPVINRSTGGTAIVTFAATDTDTTALASGTYTFPLTVASAPNERLVIIGGIGGSDADFSACTIDGQTGTRVGVVARGEVDGTGYAPFLTAYRAHGTSSTSINVVATIGGTLKTWTSAFCACWTANGVGALNATRADANSFPTLSVDVVANGAIVAGMLGYSNPGVHADWTGLNEDFDLEEPIGGTLFSGASQNLTAAETPHVVTGIAYYVGVSFASFSLSFLPSGAANSSLAAGVGAYSLTGTNAATRRAFRLSAPVEGIYALTGTPATASKLKRISADPASYALTGAAVVIIKSGANKVLDATIGGTYALTGTVASPKRGKKVIALGGTYSMAGTTVATGIGLIAAGGTYAFTGTNATPVKTTGSGASISISVSGNLLTASVRSVTATGGTGAGISLTGNQMTVSTNSVTVSASGGVSFSVTSPGAITASVNSVAVSILGGIGVTPSGNEMTALVGNAVVNIPGQTVIAAMPPMILSTGTVQVTVPGSTYVNLFGNEMTASTGAFNTGGIGDGTVTTGQQLDIDATELGMTASVGSVTSGSTSSVTATGIGMTASVGTVTVTAKQVVSVSVSGNAMVAYVGRLRFVGGGTVVLFPDQTKEGQMLKPSNWMGG